MLYLLRKKAILKFCAAACFLWCFVFQTESLHAQRVEMNMTDHDSKPLYFGITLGANLARFQTELHPRFLQYDSVYVAEPLNSGGITLGLSATTRLSNRFQFRFNPQLMFIERSIFYKLKYPDPIDNSTEVTKKVESVIMSFPFQLKFQSDRIGNFRVYTLAGFKADLDMASNARKKRADELVKIDGFDYGPEFGIGFNFFFDTFIFSPEIRISNGMRNIHSRDENLKFSNVFDKIQSRMIIFTIHLEG
jgi:hypothetical protein